MEEGYTPGSRKDTGFEFKKLLALEPSALDPLDNPETLEVLVGLGRTAALHYM